MDKLNKDVLAEISKKIDDAQKDDTPFLINQGDDTPLAIVGDANKTKVKRNDYKIRFNFPEGLLQEVPEGAIHGVGCIYLEEEFKDRLVTPSQQLIMMDCSITLLEFFHELKEDGTLEKSTENQLFKRFARAGEKLHLAIYEFVATFLGIPDNLAGYMMVGSVMSALIAIIDNHPELINESEIFLESSGSEPVKTETMSEKK